MADQQRPTAPDRREALKARHRKAIVTAAAALMTEIGGTDFTVDQLAARADVSRRTVFNHFTTVDDITVEVFHEMLGAVLDNVDANFEASAAEHAGETSMFDQLAGALRATDLVGTTTELTRIFGPDSGPRSARQAVLFERAINDLGIRIATITLRHRPEADPLEVDLMCGALVGGALVVVRHWEQSTGGVDTVESRRVWDELLERMISVNRAGFGTLTPRTGAS
ncbi:TetR family transcriptional regulator [Nocardiopsis sp. Huas11]|uniref:TetR/AcrR family transcriptional regulator n=1 Tax=Nocardiopsis sp. Huas11 TaxID=2183912 RepID=UPI000EAC0FFF|nr:TetR/AcrR family transcriptional regulator [Nocardiopsis sp. Huas11]RKS10284.1 TetR family transcriptional regulator [Nocardiopsis sp. Huas11]